MDGHPPEIDWASSIHSEWVKIMIAVEQPAPDSLAGCDRRQKLEKLEANARYRQANLLQWLAEHELSREVKLIGQSTSFNLIWAYSTPRALQALRDAPGVVSVRVTQEDAVGKLH